MDVALLLLLAIEAIGTFALAVSHRPTVIAIADACVEILLPGGLAFVVGVSIVTAMMGR